jgi:hypothetical protein
MITGTGGASTMRSARGYILFETVVALGILSVSIYTIHAGMRQALMLRARAQDFTIAQFLLEQAVETRLLQYELVESSGSDSFPAPHDRYFYTWAIEKVEVPLPPLPPQLTVEMSERFIKQYKRYMGRLSVTVEWRRHGIPYEIKGETLISPEKLWMPPAVREGF